MVVVRAQAKTADTAVARIKRMLVSAAIIAGILATSGAGAGQPPPVFRGTSDIVRVFVTVTDRGGRLTTALTREAFEVRDEGKPQPITQFDNTPQPIRLIVMLDVSGSMEGNLPLLRDAAAQLFTRLRPEDVTRVGTFGREVTISPAFTHDPNQLRAQLPEAIAPDAPTPLWRAIDKAINAFAGGGDERPVILVLSDGKDTGPASFREPVVSQAQVIDRAQREDVMIYAIGLRSRGARPMQPGLGRGGLQAMLLADMPDPGLARVAEDTGGGYTEIRFGQDLGAAFAAVADELHSQYLLGFAPPRRDGKTHSLDVRVNQAGLKPRARKSYVAPKS
jgi:Ca-activated chloride channel family protein